MKNKVYLIDNFSWTWKKRITIFVSIFGGLWLFIEPMVTFNLFADFFKELNFTGYAILILTAIFSTSVVEMIDRRMKLKNYDFISFTIRLIRKGGNFPIHAPKDIKIEMFIEKFANYLDKKHGIPDIRIKNEISKSTLAIKRRNDFVKLNPEQTLVDAGIKEGEVCYIERYIDLKESHIESSKFIVGLEVAPVSKISKMMNLFSQKKK